MYLDTLKCTEITMRNKTCGSGKIYNWNRITSNTLFWKDFKMKSLKKTLQLLE